MTLEIVQQFRQIGSLTAITVNGAGVGAFAPTFVVPTGAVLVPTAVQVDLQKNAAGGESCRVFLEDSDNVRYAQFEADAVGSQGFGLEGNTNHVPVGMKIGPFTVAKTLTLRVEAGLPVTTQKVAALVTMHQVIGDPKEIFDDLNA